MPKIKTVNGVNEIKSGYVSLSPRIKIRENDNFSNSYPNIHRLGDPNRKGNTLLDAFNDQNTFIYGKLIKDSFEESGVFNTTNINKNKWTFSSGLTIKNEIFRKAEGESSLGRSLVFSGKETTRFISTKEKVRNVNIISNNFVVTFD